MNRRCQANPFNLALTMCLALSAPLALAGAPPGKSDWRWQVEGAALSRFDADIDTGGEVGVNRYFVDASVSRRYADGTRVGISIGYGQSRYDFSGGVQLGSANPWDRIQQASLSASVFHPIDEDWTLYGIPSLRFDGETGVSFSDGQTLGLLAGASYRFSNGLTIGPGVGVFEEIEGGSDVFPILIIDWEISDKLSLETGRGFAASRGPGLQLRWRPASAWQFAFGFRYEKQRFRLDDEGVAPDGIGEDKSFPVFALAQYQASPDVVLSLIGGFETSSELRLEDSSGSRIAESDIDTAPFLGASLQIRM